MTASGHAPAWRRPVSLMASCFAGLVALSWFRLWYVGTANLDGLPVDMPWEIGRRTAMFFLFCGAGLSFLRLLSAESGEGDVKGLLISSVLIQAVLLFSLPLTSNDIFSNLAYGKMSILGIDADALGAAALSPDDPFRQMVTARWMTTPIVYGPVIAFMNRLVTAPESLWLSMAFFKAVSFALSLAVTALSYLYCARFKGGAPRARSFAMVALNPVFLWEISAQAHNDSVMLLGIVAFVYFVSARMEWRALLSILFAFVAKIAVLPVIGLYLAYTFFASRKRFALYLAFLASLSAVAAFYFSGKLGIILVPPDSGGVDMTRLTNTPLYLVARLLSPAGAAIQAAGYKAYWTAAMAAMGLLGLRMAWRSRSAEKLFLFGLTFTVFFNLVASPTYQPWYCLWALPFAMALGERPIVRFVELYSVVTVTQYAILNSLSGSIISLGVLALFLFYFRKDEELLVEVVGFCRPSTGDHGRR